MSLRARLALAFAVVGAVVAVLVGLLGYRAASDRIFAEIDRSLRSATVTVAQNPDRAPAVSGAATPGPDLFPVRTGRARATRRSGGRSCGPWTATARSAGWAVRASRCRCPTLIVPSPPPARAGQSHTTEVVVDGRTYRELTTALGGDRGALQVAVPVDQTHYVLGGMAREIAGAGLAVLVVAAATGRLLAGRITRRLERLATVAEEVSVVDHADGSGLEGGRDEVGRLSASLSRMLARLAVAREAQERLVQDAAHELRTPLTSLRANAEVLRRVTELSPDSRDRLFDDIGGRDT